MPLRNGQLHPRLTLVRRDDVLPCEHWTVTVLPQANCLKPAPHARHASYLRNDINQHQKNATLYRMGQAQRPGELANIPVSSGERSLAPITVYVTLAGGQDGIDRAHRQGQKEAKQPRVPPSVLSCRGISRVVWSRS
ncbi:hypothetical protein GCM10009730_54770 [Streptomyces albidochromogenes]